MKFGMQLGIITTNHFANFKQNRSKGVSFKWQKVNFENMLNVGITPKSLESDVIESNSKTFR